MNGGHLWIEGDYEHALKMWDIQDEVSKKLTLGQSSSTTCKSLPKDSFTLEEERLQLIVQVLELEFNGKSDLQSKATSACMWIGERRIWGAQIYPITFFLNFQEGFG